MGAMAVDAFVVGPRFAVQHSEAAPADAFAPQLRRAVRSLLGQRGGTMLMRAWGSDAEVRIECSVADGEASVLVSTPDAELASAVRGMVGLVRHECARAGTALARVECIGPAQPLRPAA